MDYHIDAKDKVLGRLATDISLILQGKKAATFERNRVSNDKVYLTNWDKIKISGNKATDKVYYHHTGYVGHLKEMTYQQHMEKNPKFIIRRAVTKMLPRNFLTQQRIKGLIFVDANTAKDAGKRVRPMSTRPRKAAMTPKKWQ